MVKGIVWLLTLGTLAAAVVFGIGVLNRDPGRLLGVAVAPADDQGMRELQIVINPLILIAGDPVPYTAEGREDYPTWMNTHFEVDAGSGPLNNWRRGGFKTREITELQAGAADFIGLAEIPDGTPVTVTYHPRLGEPEVYVFEIDGNPLPFKRRTFDPAY
ncbi:MAG: hypothetical protein AAF823_01875 [Planctomycetota bacterium]